MSSLISSIPFKRQSCLGFDVSMYYLSISKSWWFITWMNGYFSETKMSIASLDMVRVWLTGRSARKTSFFKISRKTYSFILSRYTLLHQQQILSWWEQRGPKLHFQHKRWMQTSTSSLAWCQIASRHQPAKQPFDLSTHWLTMMMRLYYNKSISYCFDARSVALVLNRQSLTEILQ